MSEAPSTLRRKAAVGFIFVTALIDILALGLMIPVLPNLVKQFAGGDTAIAAQYTLVFAVTWGVMQFIFGPIQGMLSDRFGRRPVLLISIFGLGIDYLFMAMAPTLSWLLVGRIINGITAASFSTANAYIADVTKPEDRAKAYGLMGAAFGIGFALGPALGGYLGSINLRLPFYVSAALALANWLYGFFILPESLPPEHRSATLNWKKANPVGALSLLASKPHLLGLSAIYALFQLAHGVFPAIFVLFVGWRYGWGPAQAGQMLLMTGVVTIIIQGGVVGRVVKLVGERGALLIGLASALAAFLVYAFAPTGPLFLVGILAGALTGLTGPGLQGLMTRRVGPSEQGRLQGANSAIMGICAIIGPIVYLSVLSFTVRHNDSLHLPGLPILIAAGLTFLGLLLAVKEATPVPDASPAEA
ncbi:MAG: TCR/Tet family MFS transporter [Pseudomonadota bacterium]|jgi:DHA1 family tetracycline resistance protein-like MFS transporter